MGAPFRTVVVDDSLVFLAAVCRAVQEHPELELVGRARDGDEAVAVLRDVRPDLALVDVLMPGMSGPDVLDAVRGDGLPTSFVLMSGMSEDELALTSARAGAASFADKSREPSFIVDVGVAIAHRWDGLR